MIKKNTVYICSLLIATLIATFAIFCNEYFIILSNLIFEFLTKRFGWLYLISMFIFVLFSFSVATSKYGTIKLGKDDSKPEFRNISWFSMLFCAGMGVGLIFWGISEPLSHFLNPIPGINSGSNEAIDFAFKSVFMHWGIHPWAAYTVIGLPLAYFQFRKEKIGLISSTLEPLIGVNAITGWLGNIIDIFSAFATIAGITTSLGLGAMQISSGLESTLNIPNNTITQIIIIITVTIVFIISAVSGIDKGVKKLSNITLSLVGIFMIICFIIGPKQEILNNFVNGIGLYLNDFFKDSLWISSYSDTSWILGWRIFYWAWWIAWAPFVGMFIAKISKGRTIREFIFGVMCIPALASFLWFSIFGSMGIHLRVNGVLNQDTLVKIVNSPEIGIFIVLEKYPIAIGTSMLTIILLISFFITSADSGTFVLACISSEGSNTPTNYKKIIWGIFLALIAISLLLAGGLKSLQTISIAAAFPFIFVMMAACISMLRALKDEENI